MPTGFGVGTLVGGPPDTRRLKLPRLEVEVRLSVFGMKLPGYGNPIYNT